MPSAMPTKPQDPTKDATAESVDNLYIPKTSYTKTQPPQKKRKIICFSDFDGTIFMQDSGHVLFDNYGCGPAQRDILDEQIKTGERSFRDVSEDMWASLNVPFEDGFVVLEKELDIDPGFQEFHNWCIKENIPFNVISAGLKPILRRILDGVLGEEAARHIDIVANDATINEDGSQWKPVWRHDTELGHDKARSINEYRALADQQAQGEEVPLIVFIGDGVSDLPAANQADVLFARRGLHLEEYCIANKIPYIGYSSFADIHKEIQKLQKEDEEKTGGVGKPARFNPRANLWRQLSSQAAIPLYMAATPREEKMMLWPEVFSQPGGAAGAANGSKSSTEEAKLSAAA